MRTSAVPLAITSPFWFVMVTSTCAIGRPLGSLQSTRVTSPSR